MPMIVELLRGFAPQILRDAIGDYGKEHPNVIARYTGDFDAYVPKDINGVTVVTERGRPTERSSIFHWRKSGNADTKANPESGSAEGSSKYRCFRVRPMDASINFIGIQLRFKNEHGKCFP